MRGEEEEALDEGEGEFGGVVEGGGWGERGRRRRRRREGRIDRWRRRWCRGRFDVPPCPLAWTFPFREEIPPSMVAVQFRGSVVQETELDQKEDDGKDRGKGRSREAHQRSIGIERVGRGRERGRRRFGEDEKEDNDRYAEEGESEGEGEGESFWFREHSLAVCISSSIRYCCRVSPVSR